MSHSWVLCCISKSNQEDRLLRAPMWSRQGTGTSHPSQPPRYSAYTGCPGPYSYESLQSFPCCPASRSFLPPLRAGTPCWVPICSAAPASAHQPHPKTGGPYKMSTPVNRVVLPPPTLPTDNPQRTSAHPRVLKSRGLCRSHPFPPCPCHQQAYQTSNEKRR